jgi:hypothetical protein
MNKTLITVHHLTDIEQSMMSINHILHGALKDDTIVEYDFSKFVQSEQSIYLIQCLVGCSYFQDLPVCLPV